MPAVGTHGKQSSYFKRAVRRHGSHADYPAVLLDQVSHVGMHPQVKCRIAAGVLGDEIEEVPLRHEGDEPAAGRQMREVGDGNLDGADIAARLAGFLVRTRQ